jgi:hypothetical protein
MAKQESALMPLFAIVAAQGSLPVCHLPRNRMRSAMRFRSPQTPSQKASVPLPQ